MLYLDYSRKDGEWIPNVHGGREHLEAIGLLQEANATAYKLVPGIVTIAEESTSWPGVTKATSSGGLGFGLKWNMGWMNDTLRYLKEEPIHRQYHHNLLTFSLMYAFSENYLLPISHDEVVHGKGSLLTKIPGSREDQLATLRAFLAYMWSHPGKQLLFMGSEFAQPGEWADGRSLDWWLLDHAAHYRVHALVKELNRVYQEHPAMWALDSQPAGFRWLDADDNTGNLLSYLRFAQQDQQGDVLATVVNYSGDDKAWVRVGVPRPGRWEVVLDTSGFDEASTPSQAGAVLEAEASPWHDQPYSVTVRVAALATLYLAPVAAEVGCRDADSRTRHPTRADRSAIRGTTGRRRPGGRGVPPGPRPCWSSTQGSGSDEQQLGALGELDEVARRDDRLDPVVEVVLGQVVHVRRHPAGPQVGTGGGEQLEELGHLGHVLLGDLLLEHRGRRGRGTGEGAEHVVDAHAAVARRVHRGVADEGELQVAHRRLVDHVEAPEGEEQVGLDALTQRGVGEDQARVGHVEACPWSR